MTLQDERNAQSGDSDRKEIDGANWPTLHINAHKIRKWNVLIGLIGTLSQYYIIIIIAQ